MLPVQNRALPIGNLSRQDPFFMELITTIGISPYFQNELPQRRSRREIMPGELIQKVDLHSNVISFTPRKKLRLDRPCELFQRVAAGHLMQVDSRMLHTRHPRIHYVAGNLVHVTGLALLALFGITAVLPL